MRTPANFQESSLSEERYRELLNAYDQINGTNSMQKHTAPRQDSLQIPWNIPRPSTVYSNTTNNTQVPQAPVARNQSFLEWKAKIPTVGFDEHGRLKRVNSCPNIALKSPVRKASRQPSDVPKRQSLVLTASKWNYKQNLLDQAFYNFYYDFDEPEKRRKSLKQQLSGRRKNSVLRWTETDCQRSRSSSSRGSSAPLVPFRLPPAFNHCATRRHSTAPHIYDNSRFILHEWGSNALVHGLRKVFENQPFNLRRLLWLLIVLGAVVVIVHHTHHAIKYFQTRPVSLNVKVTHHTSLPMPAISICNLNAFRATVTDQQNRYRLLSQIFRKQFKQLHINNVTLYELENVLLDDLYTSAAHQKEDLILMCSWDKQNCSVEEFEMTLTDFGVCYTFNSGRDGVIRPVTRSGSAFGLQLLVNLEQYEYMRGPHTGAGLKILVHDQSEQPLVETYGFVVPPGSHSNVEIKYVETSDLPPPHGVCDSSRSLKYYGNYTRINCLSECRQFYAQDRCNCRDYYMSSKDIGVWYPVCTVGEYQSCLADNLDYFQKHFPAMCDCPEPCHSHFYETAPSYGAMSSKEVDLLLKLIRGNSFNSNDTSSIESNFVEARDLTQRLLPSIYEKDTRMIHYFIQTVKDVGNLLNQAMANLVLLEKQINDMNTNLLTRLDFHEKPGLGGVKAILKEQFIKGWENLKQEVFTPFTADAYPFTESFRQILLQMEENKPPPEPIEPPPPAPPQGRPAKGRRPRQVADGIADVPIVPDNADTDGTDPANTPTDDPANTPTDDPADTPTDDPADTPTDDLADTPTDDPADTPTEDPADTPTEDPADTPTEDPADTPTEDPADTPTEDLADTPTEDPADTPTDDSSDPAGDTPGDPAGSPPPNDATEDNTPNTDVPDTIDDNLESPDNQDSESNDAIDSTQEGGSTDDTTETSNETPENPGDTDTENDSGTEANTEDEANDNANEKKVNIVEVLWHMWNDRHEVKIIAAFRLEGIYQTVINAFSQGTPLIKEDFTYNGHYDSAYITKELLDSNPIRRAEVANDLLKAIKQFRKQIPALQEILQTFAETFTEDKNQREAELAKLEEIADSYNDALYIFEKEVIKTPQPVIERKIEVVRSTRTRYQTDFADLKAVISDLQSYIADMNRTVFSNLWRISKEAEAYVLNPHMTKSSLSTLFSSPELGVAVNNAKLGFTDITTQAAAIRGNILRLQGSIADIWNNIMNENVTMNLYEVISHDFVNYTENDQIQLAEVFADLLEIRPSDITTMNNEELKVRLNADISLMTTGEKLIELSDFISGLVNYTELGDSVSDLRSEFTDTVEYFTDTLHVYEHSAHLNAKFVRDNILRLNLYMKDLETEHISEDIAYDSLSLLGDIGGGTGLFLGISVMTLMELLDIFIHLILKCVVSL